MIGASNRRGFFRHLVGETAKGARDVAPLIPGPLSVAARALPEPPESQELPDPIIPAAPTKFTVTADELSRLVRQRGLHAREDAIQAFANTSIRLTPAPAGKDSGSYLVAGATPAASVLRQSWNGRPLQVIAQLDLAGLPPQTKLPREGTLLLPWALRASPTGLSTSDGGSVSVVHLEQSMPPPLGAQAVEVSAELCLPRVWSRDVQGLYLTDVETEKWQTIRRELALRQGVPLLDEEPPLDGETAMHRLLGYPDERLGQMRIACEAAARGIDLEGRQPYEHPDIAGLEKGSASGRWQLLFQLSLDHSLSWDWGPHRRRLYVWIDRDALSESRFENVWAITQ